MVSSSGWAWSLASSVVAVDDACRPATLQALRRRPGRCAPSAACAWSRSSSAWRARGVEAEHATRRSACCCAASLPAVLPSVSEAWRHVEDVVDHLEGQADRGAVVARAPARRAASMRAAGRAHQHAGLQQRAGLAPVHVAQRALVERQADAGEVDRLAAGHAGVAGRARQQARTARACSAGATPPSSGVSTSKASACIASPASIACGLAELHVHGRLAAAQHVVVHARQVVVDQRIGVDQLDRAGGAQRRLALAAAPPRAAASTSSGRSRLPPSSTRVAHRLAEAGRRVGAAPRRRAPPRRRRARARRPRRRRSSPASLRCVHGLSCPSSSTLTCSSTA